MSGPDKNQEHSWLKEANTISEDVAVYYNDWARMKDKTASEIFFYEGGNQKK